MVTLTVFNMLVVLLLELKFKDFPFFFSPHGNVLSRHMLLAGIHCPRSEET